MVRSSKVPPFLRIRAARKKRGIAKKSSDGEEQKMEKKPKKKKKMPKVLKECLECADVGSIRLIASYLDIPPEPISGSNDGTKKSRKNNSKKKAGPKIETDSQEIGCIPWRLSLVHQLRKDANGGYSTHVLKLALLSDHRTDIAWRAEVSGTLTMKKWLEKLPEGTNPRKLDQYSERFATIFNQCDQRHAFRTEFPLPIGGIAFSNNCNGTAKKDGDDDDKLAADANAYLKNRQFQFELQLLVHDAQFSHQPRIDFHKKQPFSNVVINIGNTKFHVNKEYLSMHSSFFDTMFTAQGFVESREQQATLRGDDVFPSSFNEFLKLLYDPLDRFFASLLELARRYTTQSVTNRCEQRLLFMRNDDQTITVAKRLKLADKFGLVSLKAKLIVKNDADELLKLDHTVISAKTREMLERKKRATAEQEKEEEEEAKRKAEEDKQNAENMDVDGQPGTSAAVTGGRGVHTASARGQGAVAGRGQRGVRGANRRGVPGRGGVGARGRGLFAAALYDLDLDNLNLGFDLL